MDGKIIKDILSGPIQTARHRFDKYIEYYNKVVSGNRDDKIWCEMRRLAEWYKEEEGEDKKERDELRKKIKEQIELQQPEVSPTDE